MSNEEVAMESGEPEVEFDEHILALLNDPSLWEEPSPELEQRVVTSVAATVVATRSRHRSPWPARLGAAVLGAVAATLIVLAVRPANDGRSADATVQLAGTDLAANVTGRADIAATTSGVGIYFSVPGLPRRDGGEFYEAWLKNCDGTKLIPVGTFHDLTDAIGWAGVSTADFPVLTVTREVAAAPKDAAQGTSGEVVLKGALAPCPAG